MLTPNRVHDPVVAPHQYAVVLVNEEQLDQLMRRPAMRQINSRWTPNDVYARYQRLKRRTAAAALLLVLLSGALLWFLTPQPAMASMFPWTARSEAPTIPTGASFSVTIASLESGDGASSVAARARGLGLPAFTRRSPGKRQLYQAMVGPFASLDEAERAQRRLGGQGYRGARLFVDESLRGAPRGDAPVGIAHGDHGVLLLGAPDRLSLVLELGAEPRRVNSNRTAESWLDIDVGPLSDPVRPQQWIAPDGVHLLQTVAIQGVTASGGGHYLRARVVLPEFARANVRTEGRRVYVDLTWPSEHDVSVSRRSAGGETAKEYQEGRGPGRATATADEAPGLSRQEDQYRAAMEPVYQRVADIQPFLRSAAQSDSAEVMAALDQTLADLESALLEMAAPASASAPHRMFVSATQVARRGLAPAFTGDRLAQAHKAIDMFDEAIASSATPPAR